MIRLLRLLLTRIPESWLHQLHREARHAWRLRRPAGDWPPAEAALRRSEVRDAITRSATLARRRAAGDVEAELRARINLQLIVEVAPTEQPSPVLRAYASLAGWMYRRWQVGPTMVGVCEACEHANRGAYHLDVEGRCASCGGPFLADVPLLSLASGEDPPALFEVDLDAAIHPAHLEAPC